jgi:hypothetical protein
MLWTDTYSGEAFRIKTDDAMWGSRIVRVQSYGDVIARYHTHPEAKSLGPNGEPCNRRTVGLLQRRPVRMGELVHIGKETNRLEEVEQGLVHDWDEVQLVFRDSNIDISAPGTMNPRMKHHSNNKRACAECGSSLHSIRMVYCSPACRQRSYRRRNKRR